MSLRVAVLAVTSLVPSYTALAASPVDSAWATLQQCLSGNEDHKRAALTALGAVDSQNEKAVKTLVDALQDKDPLVRQAAAAALGEMKARQAIGSLRDAISDKGEVAFAAAKSLSEMGDSGGRDMFVAMIAHERSDAPGMVANGIRDARKRLKHPEGLLLEGVGDAGGALFPPAGYGISAAKEAFKEKGSSSRAVAASYLAKDPDPYAVTLLEWALSDNSWGVRAAAAHGLALRGNAESIPKLQFLLDDQRHVVQSMAAAAILRISDRLANPDQQTQAKK